MQIIAQCKLIMERQGVEKKLWEAWEDNHPDGAYKTSMLQTLSQLLGTS